VPRIVERSEAEMSGAAVILAMAEFRAPMRAVVAVFALA